MPNYFILSLYPRGKRCALVITITVSLFLKDFLQNYLNYKKIRDKLPDVVGKGGSVIFNKTLYKVEQIDRKGILLKNNYETVFIGSLVICVEHISLINQANKE